MPYTTDDLNAIDAAIKELAMGKRKTEVRIGEVWVQYDRIQLGELFNLRRRILRELMGRPAVVLTTTSKGL